MYDDEELSEIREAHAEWEAETLDPTLDRHGERRDRFATVSNHEVDRLYTPPTWPTSTTRRISDSRARSRTRGRLPDDAPRTDVDDAAVRRVRHRRGDERAVPLSDR